MYGELHAAQPQPLEILDLPIRVRRDLESLEIQEAELVVPAHPERAAGPRQLRWHVDGSLLPDEMLLVFERTLDWTGPVSRMMQGLPLVQGVFPQPFVLTRARAEAVSGLPRVHFPPEHPCVGWGFAAVLVRGEDSPWIRSSVLRLRRSE